MDRLRVMFSCVDSGNSGMITLDQFLAFWELQDVRALFAVMGLEITRRSGLLRRLGCGWKRVFGA